jgi:deferrochelatase/peroxidase EfeB
VHDGGRDLTGCVDGPENPEGEDATRAALSTVTFGSSFVAVQQWRLVTFGHSLAPFEAHLRRMLGLDDGIADALFQFTHPVTGAYCGCPAVADARLVLPA